MYRSSICDSVLTKPVYCNVMPAQSLHVYAAGRDAWSHAYQPGEIKNITQEQAIDYLVSRSISQADAQELVKVCISSVLLCDVTNTGIMPVKPSRCQIRSTPCVWQSLAEQKRNANAMVCKFLKHINCWFSPQLCQRKVPWGYQAYCSSALCRDSKTLRVWEYKSQNHMASSCSTGAICA